MTPHTINVLLYALLSVLAVLVGWGHVRAARASGAPGLYLIGLVYWMEGVELAVLWLAVLHVYSPQTGAVLLTVARMVTLLRYAIGQGMIVGARHGKLPIGSVTTLPAVGRFVVDGYTHWARLRLRRLFRRR